MRTVDRSITGFKLNVFETQDRAVIAYPMRMSLCRTFLKLLSVLAYRLAGMTVLVVATHATALERSFVFRSISSADGLVQNTVNAMHQDRRGFVWIGTQGGLHRYDGYHFKIFQNDPARSTSIPDSLINAIDEDELGGIWIGTDGDGAARLDADSGAVLQRVILPGDQRVTALRYIQGVGVWVGTRAGLYLAQPGKAARLLLPLTNNDQVTAIEIDLQGVLWVGTQSGSIYALKAGKFESVAAPDMGWIHQFSVDAANRILIAAAGGLFEISPERVAVKRWLEAAKNLTAIAQAPDGAFWLAIDGYGLRRLDLSTGQQLEFQVDTNLARSLPDSAISSLMIDSSGQLWIGTRTRGVALTDTAGAPFKLLHNPDDITQGPGANNVRALCAQGDVLWIGTENGNLHRRVSKAKSEIGSQDLVTPVEGLRDTDFSDLMKSKIVPPDNFSLNPQKQNKLRINALACGNAQELIIATSNGAFSVVVDATNVASVSPLLSGEQQHQQIRSLLVARDGGIWLGTNETGLIRLDATRRVTEFYPRGTGQMPAAMVLSLFEDQQGRIWAGTIAGLAMLSPGQGVGQAHWQQFFSSADSRSIPSNLVRTIMQQRDGTLWIGTHSGLARLDKLDPPNEITNNWRAKFSRFTIRDGLPNPTVYCLQEDKFARLWLSGNLGLVSFYPETSQWRSFDLQDGLQDLEFNGGACTRLDDGRLAFGGVAGTNLFRPESIKDSNFNAHVALLSVQVAGVARALRADQRYAANFSERSIGFEFAALDLRTPKRNGYAYKLEGFDKIWQTGNGLGQANYNNLAPGQYRFLARGSNRDGVWNPAQMEIGLTVLPPWYTSGYALWAYAITVGALIWVYGRQRRRSQLREQRYLDELKEREDRLRLSLWGSRDLYWDYSVDGSGSTILSDTATSTGALLALNTAPEKDAAAWRHTFRRAETELVLGPGMDGSFDAAEYLMNQVHPDDVEALLDEINRVLISETEELSSEHRVKRADGTWSWLLARGRVVRRDHINMPRQIAGTARNMDSARAAALELEISGRVIERMSEAVAVSGEDGKLIKVNAAFEQMSGYSEAEVLGRSVALLESPRHDALQYQSIQEMVRKDGRWKGEMWQRRKDGADILVSIEFTRIEGAPAEGKHVIAPIRVAVMSDITDRKRAEEELRFLANFDALTGLPNRTKLLTRMARAFARAKRHEHRVAILFLDLDRFKQINDSLGHAAGDELLRGVADRMRLAVREIDTVARLGGDEFVLLVEEISSFDGALIAAHRVLERFAEPFNLAGTDVVVSPSIGLAVFPDHSERPDELLKCADLAMYAAKSAGRNTISVYQSEQSSAAIERAATEMLLRRALDRDQFEVYYQLAVDMRSGQAVGVEALLRWRHPQQGLVGPDAFVPIMEDNGMIIAVGAWVLSEALAQLKAWDLSGLTGLYVSVNLSILQLNRGNLVLELTDLLARYDLPGARLTLELTESLVMANPEQSIETLNRISALGVQIAIDDFGTGYSSLAYLKRLPIDKLKIDKTFVRDLGADSDDTAITHSIIALGQTLGLTIIAEGVETEIQQNLLLGLGCVQAQGYLYARPLSATDCTTRLHERSIIAANGV
jgi:diguanylate cyclase (GGDEF)-like protein/PAS domain S-box-containing protein